MTIVSFIATCVFVYCARELGRNALTAIKGDKHAQQKESISRN